MFTNPSISFHSLLKGLTFSQREPAAGNGVHCFGKVTHVYVARGRAVQRYRVKWDSGEVTQSTYPPHALFNPPQRPHALFNPPHLAKDRFDRVLRYWARGPMGVEDTLTHEPWAEVNWMINGFNEVRRREMRTGSRITPVESMVTWTGACGAGGIPHLSYIKRKPKPLGCEFKSVCDGSTGVCLFIETQEGEIRMQRKSYCDVYPATTACTVRMVHKMGLSETMIAPAAKLRRVVTADSWFASRKTVMACKEELGVDFTGPIKTATRGFPVEAMRWTLSTMTRGDHCVFKEEGAELWAIGWSDVHYKLYISTNGITTPGNPALKKRQRADGRNYQIQVPRPAVVAKYQSEMGWVDRHNRYRQSMLGLSAIWKTKRWQTRIQTEVLAMSMVDAFLLARKFMPKWRGQPDTDSVFWRFVRCVLPQIGSSPERQGSSSSYGRCVQVLIGKAAIKAGPKMGQLYAKQQRCRQCIANNRKEKKSDGACSGRSPRTAYTCIAHPETFMCRKGKGVCWEEHLACIEDAGEPLHLVMKIINTLIIL